METSEKRQDIGICRTCKYFKEVNDPKVDDGKSHWGVGFMCTNHSYFVPWRKENAGTVAETVEEFEHSFIYFDHPTSAFYDCPQHPAPDFVREAIMKAKQEEAKRTAVRKPSR